MTNKLSSQLNSFQYKITFSLSYFKIQPKTRQTTHFHIDIILKPKEGSGCYQSFNYATILFSKEKALPNFQMKKNPETWATHLSHLTNSLRGE